MIAIWISMLSGATNSPRPERAVIEEPECASGLGFERSVRAHEYRGGDWHYHSRHE
jgi:hypothetical protein